MSDLHCTHCGEGGLEVGFILDSDQIPRSARWLEGTPTYGIFGGVKLTGQPRWEIDAYRCRHCHHLELFASRPD